MANRLLRMRFAVPLVAFVAAACSSGGDGDTTAKKPRVEYEVLAEAVSPDDSLSQLRYFDGDQITLNDRCPVRKVPLNPRMTPAYVNGHPVGFC